MAIDTLFLPTTGTPLYKITLDSVVCNSVTNLQTWTYTVTKLGGQDISNWALQICPDLQVILSSPGGAEIGPPGGGQGNCLNGQNGCPAVSRQIKWNASGGTFSFTISGCRKCQKVLTAIKAGNPCFCGMILGPCCDPNSPECRECVSNTTIISATVNVNAQYSEEASWTIDKSVTPDAWNFTQGQSGISQYTITVIKNTIATTGTINGTICVKNEGSVATQGLAISYNLEVDTGGGFTTLLTNQTVNVSGNPSIPAGQEICYSYSVNLNNAQVFPGATYRVTAHATITNYTNHLGENFGPTKSGTTVFPQTPTIINFNQIVVRDPQLGLNEVINMALPVTTITRSRTFTCTNEGTNVNTARLYGIVGQNETEIDSASATVTVSCTPTPPSPPSRGIKFNDIYDMLSKYQDIINNK